MAPPSKKKGGILKQGYHQIPSRLPIGPGPVDMSNGEYLRIHYTAFFTYVKVYFIFYWCREGASILIRDLAFLSEIYPDDMPQAAIVFGNAECCAGWIDGSK